MSEKQSGTIVTTISTASQPQLSFKIVYHNEIFCTISVIVPASLVDALYHEVSLCQQRSAWAQGFPRGAVPLEYIQTNFKSTIIEHLKEFIFKFYVTNFLYAQIHNNQLVIGGEPQLSSIVLEPHYDAIFSFECTHISDFIIHDWRYFPFKAPVRKNYKDLDKQVKLFLKLEQQKSELTQTHTIGINDWVNLTITLYGHNNEPLSDMLSQSFWFKLNNMELENPLCKILIGKAIGDSFYCNDHWLHECFSQQLDVDYLFHITVADIMPYYFFSIDLFKNHFRIKTNKDAHKKMIEIFSYSHDISQRLSTVESSLRILINKHPFTPPQHLLLQQQEILLEEIQKNPDYEVYRAQKNFTNNLIKLAERQLKELIIIDHLAYHEKVEVDDQDIKSYLNLRRPKIKDFIYFDVPLSKIHGQEVPIATEQLKLTCLREKTINHLIYHLTKK